MECCRVDDMSPENTIVDLSPFLQAELIQMLADCTSASISFSQVVRGRPRGLLLLSWWSERRTDSSVILPGIWTCHVAKEAQPSCFNDTWNWRAAGSLPDRSVDNVSNIRNPKLPWTLRHVGLFIVFVTCSLFYSYTIPANKCHAYANDNYSLKLLVMFTINVVQL